MKIVESFKPEIYARGKAEGREEGRKEGREEEKREIAKNLLAQGTSIEVIASSTGLSEEFIESLMTKH